MSTTTNLQLEKPDKDEYYDIQVQNANMDKIDAAVEELKKSVSDGKTLVANAITDKGVSTSKDATFQTMAANINTIKTNPTLQAKSVTLSTSAQTIKADSGYDGLSQVTVPAVSGTAVAGDVLSGKTFASASGIAQSGTMANNGAVNQTLAINGTYTIPSGYHNGSGKVTQNITTKGAAIYTPSTTDQIISSGQYLSGTQTIKGDSKLIPSNIVSGVTIFGVTGTGGRKYVSSLSSYWPEDYPSNIIFYQDDTSYNATKLPQLHLGIDFIPSVVKISFTVGSTNYIAVIHKDSRSICYESSGASGVTIVKTKAYFYEWIKPLDAASKKVNLFCIDKLGATTVSDMYYEAWE